VQESAYRQDGQWYLWLEVLNDTIGSLAPVLCVEYAGALGAGVPRLRDGCASADTR